MKKGIKQKDIYDFQEAVDMLNKIMNRIVKYSPNARLFVTPQEVHLMSGFREKEEEDEEENIVSSASLDYMDCGDW